MPQKWQEPTSLNSILMATEEEIKTAKKTITDYISMFKIEDCKEILQSWLKSAVTSNSNDFEEPRDRKNIWFFSEEIERLLEAIYLLYGKK